MSLSDFPFVAIDTPQTRKKEDCFFFDKENSVMHLASVVPPSGVVDLDAVSHLLRKNHVSKYGIRVTPSEILGFEDGQPKRSIVVSIPFPELSENASLGIVDVTTAEVSLREGYTTSMVDKGAVTSCQIKELSKFLACFNVPSTTNAQDKVWALTRMINDSCTAVFHRLRIPYVGRQPEYGGFSLNKGWVCVTGSLRGSDSAINSEQLATYLSSGAPKYSMLDLLKMIK